MVIYTKLLNQQREEEAQFESALGSAGIKSEVRSYGTSAYSSSMSRNQVDEQTEKYFHFRRVFCLDETNRGLESFIC